MRYWIVKVNCDTGGYFLCYEYDSLKEARKDLKDCLKYDVYYGIVKEVDVV